jgi:hypothetical protein
MIDMCGSDDASMHKVSIDIWMDNRYSRICQAKKAEAAEKYKDDPEALRDSSVDAIDDFLRQNSRLR